MADIAEAQEIPSQRSGAGLDYLYNDPSKSAAAIDSSGFKTNSCRVESGCRRLGFKAPIEPSSALGGQSLARVTFTKGKGE